MSTAGFIGVDIFFVLSGFLITALLLQEWERTGGIDLKRFFVRRALRLMPALATMFAVCWIIALIYLPAEEAAKFGKAAIINLLFQGNRVDILGLNAVGAYMHTWSLAVEDKFYLLWPVALGAASLTQKFDRRWLVLAFTRLWALPPPPVCESAGWVATATEVRHLYFGLENARADRFLSGCLDRYVGFSLEHASPGSAGFASPCDCRQALPWRCWPMRHAMRRTRPPICISAASRSSHWRRPSAFSRLPSHPCLGLLGYWNDAP